MATTISNASPSKTKTFPFSENKTRAGRSFNVCPENESSALASYI